jgi:hypothetical protein
MSLQQTQIDNIIAAYPVNQKKVKIYCDKWVHEGVCAFTQQGCKYKHEMPFDKATQITLGLFHGLPNWYKKHQTELQRQRELNDRLTIESSSQVITRDIPTRNSARQLTWRLSPTKQQQQQQQQQQQPQQQHQQQQKQKQTLAQSQLAAGSQNSIRHKPLSGKYHSVKLRALPRHNVVTWGYYSSRITRQLRNKSACEHLRLGPHRSTIKATTREQPCIWRFHCLP